MSAAIVFEGVSKRYRIGRRGRPARRDLLGVVADAAKSPIHNYQRLRATAKSDADDSNFWALQAVSFELEEGGVLGIIGRNGAGKSTLLKLVSRITEPTRGYVDIVGRVGSLLEVGTGFHPELTGRENVYLNGSILGMTRQQIARQFDAIVDFSGVEPFIDTPVKRYSSGMHLRLAFAVAAHLQPEILVIDEVLAVGDAEFQRKCLLKMNESARSGRTVLFVSHNLDAVRSLCPRSILIHDGELVADGPTAEVIHRYLQTTDLHLPNEWIDLTHAERRGTGAARIRSARYVSRGANTGGYPYSDGPLEIEMIIESDRLRDAGSIAATISSLSGTALISVDSVESDAGVPLESGSNRVRVNLQRLHLMPGRYRVSLRVADPLVATTADDAFDSVEQAFDIEVIGRDRHGMERRGNSLVTVDATFTSQPCPAVMTPHPHGGGVHVS